MRALRLLGLLGRLQLQRSWNQWRSLGWRPGWLLMIGLGLGILSLIGSQLVLQAFLQRLLDASSAEALLGPLRYTRYEGVADASARLMIIFVNCILFSGLCLKWGQWQSLHRDAEWDWFAEQPLPAWPLFIHRCLLESVLPQPFALFMLPFFGWLAFLQGAGVLSALMTACLWQLALQALVAAPRWLFELWLRRRRSAALVRSLRALLSFVGAGLMIMALQCLSSEPAAAARWVHAGGRLWDYTAISPAVSAVLRGRLDILSYGMLIIGPVHLICYAAAAWMLREALPPVPEWSAARVRKVRRFGWIQGLWERLHPLTRRDLRLLLRDRHFLLQVLVGPLAFALVPLSLLPHVWQPAMTAILFALAFAAGLLFLLGSVFYILPMEGRSIWMLYTWPQTLSQFLRRRLQVLLALSAAYSVLALVCGAAELGVEDWFDIGRLLYVLWGLCCFACILTALAVFDYHPERNDRPSLWTSYGIFIVGGLYAAFLFDGDGVPRLSMMLLLAGIAAVFWWQMESVLPVLLDRQTPRIGSLRFKFMPWGLALIILGTSLVWLGSHA